MSTTQIKDGYAGGSDNQAHVDNTGHLYVTGTISPGPGTGDVNIVEVGGNPVTTTIPVSGTVTATNPSVGANGTTAPTESTQVAGVNNLGNLTPLNLDSTGALIVSSSGSSTGNVNLTEVGGAAITLGQKVSASSLPVVIASDDTVAISAASLPLPTGAATSANQTTANTTLSAIQANQTNGTQKTQVTSIPTDITPATQAITAQDTSSTTTAGANGQNFITGTPTVGSAAVFILSSLDSVEVMATGTWTGTLQTEVSMDGGVTWFTRGIKQSGASYISSSFTANFEGGMNFGGMTTFRVRSTAAWTGTATIRIVASVNPGSITVSNPLTLRDATTQSITNTIKAASTAPVATDTALVVAISPNSSSTVSGTVNTNLNGLGHFQTSQYTVGTSAVQLTPTPLSNRSSVSIKVSTTSQTAVVYVGNSSGVTTTTGYGLFNGDSIQLDLTPTTTIYAISNIAGQTVYAMEIGT